MSQPAASVSLTRHDIDVGNILYGTARFITLWLPEEWDIAPGVGHPEVVAAHDRLQRKWIASGQAWYVVFHRQHGWAMELALESGRQRSLPGGAGQETIQVQGHHATVRRWQRKRGLFRPRIITYVEIRFNCEPSDRQLRLELSGRCPPEGFNAVLASVPEWRCH